MKTRIVGGDLKGLFLDVPKSGTRPTMSKVKGAIFSSIASYIDYSDLFVLDLYAGSGSLGFEAISRGAKSIQFIDCGKEAISVLKRNKKYIEDNIKKSGLTSKKEIIVTKEKALEFLRKKLGSANLVTENIENLRDEENKKKPSHKLNFDLIFIDPPYNIKNPEINDIFSCLSKLLKNETIIVIERERNTEDFVVPENMQLLKDKFYGATHVYYLRVNNEN